jgi:hypothetical protein
MIASGVRNSWATSAAKASWRAAALSSRASRSLIDPTKGATSTGSSSCGRRRPRCAGVVAMARAERASGRSARSITQVVAISVGTISTRIGRIT